MRAVGRPPCGGSPVEAGAYRPPTYRPGAIPDGSKAAVARYMSFAREEMDARCAQLDPATRM